MKYRIRFETVDGNWLMEQALTKEYMEDTEGWLTIIPETISLLETRHNFKTLTYQRNERGVDCIVEV
jgi:hypothetical protein